MRFYAFNPLAGGMLSGKHTSYVDKPMSGRFSRLQSYRNRYWKKSYFEAVSVITTKCREANIEPVEAAYRWLAYHSLLDPREGDGIIIGASNMKQLEQNLSATEKGPLSETIVNAFRSAWEEARPDCPAYFKYYSR
jgi:aflatoxin B1 aldehyde reductase